MILTTETLEKIRHSKLIKNKLALSFNKSGATIQRWLDANSDMLTTKKALLIISKELKTKEKDLVCNEELNTTTEN